MLNFLFILLFALQAFGVTEPRTDAKYTPGLYTYKNYVKNPDCEKNATLGLTGSAGSTSKQTASPLVAGATGHCRFNPAASAATMKIDIDTLDNGIVSGNCEARFTTKSTTTGEWQAYLEYDASIVGTVVSLDTSIAKEWSIPYPCNSSTTTRKLVFKSLTTPSPLEWGGTYFGKFTGQGVASQDTDWAAYTPTFGTGFGTVTSIAFEWRRKGDSIYIRGRGVVGSTSANPATWTMPTINGVAVTADTTKLQSVVQKVGSGARVGVDSIFDVLATPAANTLGFAFGTARSTIANVSVILASTNIFTVDTGPIPITGWTESQIAFNPSLPLYPTFQRLTSSSGTYVPPSGVTWIKVKMVGGGGGGGGSGTAGTTTGGTGGTTTFGSSLLTATGGLGGIRGSSLGSATGGTVTINSPATTLVSLAGAQGGQGCNFSGTNNFVQGGPGGSSPFGGFGQGGYAGAGSDGVTNTGSGGGGGGSTAAANTVCGGGGASGAYIEAVITNPSSSGYAYSIGAAGTAGVAGTGGYVGAAGGSGVVIVEEYYQSMNAPVLNGSVTSGSSGPERMERVTFGTTSTTACTATPCAFLSQSGSWITSVSRSSAGIYNLNIAAGIFSAAPTCVCSIVGVTASLVCRSRYSTATATSSELRITDNSGGLSDEMVNVQCMGPR